MANSTFMSVKDVALDLGFNENQVYKLIYNNEIPSTRLGERIYIPTELYEIWKAAKKEDAFLSTDDGKSLRQCPFCGGSARFVKRANRSTGSIFSLICCEVCGGSTKAKSMDAFQSEEEAYEVLRKAWNRRA